MKKILLSLFVGFVGIISFCSADLIFTVPNSDFIPSGYYRFTHKETINMQPGDLKCSSADSYGCYYYSPVDSTDGVEMEVSTYYCFDDYYAIDCPSVGVSFITFSQPDWNTPLMTSFECEQEYNLIPISSVDSEYCEVNNLCSSSGGGTCDGDFSGFSKFYVKHGESSWSQLSGTEFYYVYLPEYLGFNYDYSNNGRDLDFTVGVSTDTGYINNINAIQNSKPSQEDLNKLISEVIPLFVPGLAVILLLYFIFRFIKKVF